MADEPLVRDVFGANLRRIRLRRNLSQEALAAKADGLHRTEVSLLERGEREPRLSTIILLTRALEVKVATLLAGTESAVIRERQRKPSAGPKRQRR